MEQQDEEDNSTDNAVSFPASVLKQNSSTGKSWKQLDLSMITTTALSKTRPTERRHCVSALYGSYLKKLTDAHLSMVHGLYS